MDFFNSLTLDLKILVAGLAACGLLALFAGNQKTERRAMIVFAVLAAVGVYRFTHLPEDETARRAAAPPAPQSKTVTPQHKPLESTFAR